MSLIGRQHREHMRGFAGLIRFFVGYELDRLFVIIAIFKIGPFAFLVRRPERAAAIHDLFTVFVEDGFDINAAGRGHREIVGGIALAVGVHIGRAQLAFMQDVIVILVLVAVVLLVLLHLLVFLFDELERDFFGNRMARIVSCLYSDLRGVALVIEIALRISVGNRPAARADERSLAVHLATRGVGDLRFESI